MALKQPHVGSRAILDHLTNVTPLAFPLRLHLYKNFVVPDNDTVLAHLEECNFSGYAAVDLTNWATAVEDGTRDRTYADPVVFAHDGGATANDVWGYFVTDQADALLLWVEKHPVGKFSMSVATDTYPVLPAYTQRSEDGDPPA